MCGVQMCGVRVQKPKIKIPKAQKLKPRLAIPGACLTDISFQELRQACGQG